MHIKSIALTALSSAVFTLSFGQKTKEDTTVATPPTEIPTINIDDISEGGDDEGYSLLQGSGNAYASLEDPFLSTAVFTFGKYFFRQRGSNNAEVFINGIKLLNYQRGFGSLAQTGGLSDVLHDRDNTYGLSPSAYGYGGLTGVGYIDVTAANQRKGTTVTYSIANRIYRNRIMVTHNSGRSKRGWAYSLSASHRWANEGYKPGTFYNGSSFYGAVSKVVRKSEFSLSAFAAPTVRGRSVLATDEVFGLAGNKQYNSAWGYQNGEKRNARVTDVFQPVIIANHIYQPSENTRWTNAVGYEFGKNKSSTIDYYNAYSPAPDYYRNLPSYYDNDNPPLPQLANTVRSYLQANPNQLQLNWDGMYQSNYINTETIKDVNGIAGNNVTGRRSLYVLSNYVDDMKKLSFSSNLEHNFSAHTTVYGGLRFVSQDDQYYKQLADLLGGDFFLSYNQFANQQAVANPNYSQNNLLTPNQIVKTGDIYGYNVKVNLQQATAWGQSVFNYEHFDFFGSAEIGNTSFSRDGLMQNGLFENNSLGKSAALNFLTFKAKAGITYKLNAQNRIYVHADYSQDAPGIANTYISVNTRDYTVDNPVTIKSKTIEAGYQFISPLFKGRISGYATDVNDITQIMRFFNDDPSIQSFVNYVMKDMSIRSTGVEFSGLLKISGAWSLVGFASIGQCFYTNSPLVSVYQDNLPGQASVAHRVFISNYYLPVGPQSAYSMGINYKPSSRWSGRINFNYIDRNYVGINPERRTALALDLVTPGSQQWNNIVTQEKLPSAFTVDISGSRTFNLDHYFKSMSDRNKLVISFNIVNLLNNTDIKSMGYEQLRYDYAYRNPAKFPNRYDYAFGFNFLANIIFRF